jgi:cytochrome b
MAGSEQTALVWDWPLRAFHWTLVACVAGSWATHYAGIEWFEWHRRFGQAALVLVLFRIAWGFVGPHHSRFAAFVRGPRAVVAYMRGGSVAARNAGHSPLGALSVVAFLVSLLVQASTGMFANDEIANAGAFYGWVSTATSDLLTTVHAVNSNVLLGLIGLHGLAIAWHEIRGHRLVHAMITGRKSGATPAIESSRGLRAMVLVAALAAALAVAVRLAPEALVGSYW